MLDGIKRRLLHFDTDGVSIVSDFVSARQARAGMLRRTVHACFYIQCAAALLCVIIGFSAGGAVTGVLFTVGALASAAAALMAVPGDPLIGTVSYILNLVYSVICFAVGGAFTVCGAIMLISALAALVSFAAGYFRGFLLSYPASAISAENYTLTGDIPANEIKEEAPQPASGPVRSELMLIAEQVAQIMSAPQDNDRKGNIHDEHESS